MTLADLGPRDALLVVDVQRDFCPGGALAAPDGNAIVAPLNRWIDGAQRAGALVLFSRDWHPLCHPSFRSEGGPWPAHCLQDSPGAQFHHELRTPPNTLIVSKGVRFDRDQLSAFDETGVQVLLQKRAVERLWIAGLALDVCVRATALDAAHGGFMVHVIGEACRALTPEGETKTWKDFTAAGIEAA